RRRFLYEDGFLAGDSEIVVKYRHPDLQKAAEMDVWPHIAGDYRIKFKAEALPFTRPSSLVTCIIACTPDKPTSSPTAWTWTADKGVQVGQRWEPAPQINGEALVGE